MKKTWDISKFSSTGDCVKEANSTVRELPLAETFKICGVLAGVGATRVKGELMKPWSWRECLFSKDNLESSASSSTFCSKVLTCPLKSASPEPGVPSCFLLLLNLFLDKADGVSKLPAASPTIGESLVISINADRSCCFPLFLCLDFVKPVSNSSTFPENQEIKIKTKTVVNNPRTFDLIHRKLDGINIFCTDLMWKC